MDVILKIFRPLIDKWKAFSNRKKISVVLLTTGLILSVILLVAFFTRVTYSTLYTNVQPQDAASIIATLNSQNVPYKVVGNSILVPQDKAAELRMSISANNSSQTKGFEIFDQSQFWVTDSEEKVMYQQALEGELVRSIETIDAVESARVHLVLPDVSVFATDNTQTASASVIIQIKPGYSLDSDQVKAIIALVSGSVQNLPKTNVQVLDTNANLLSDGLFDDTTSTGTMSASKQDDYKKQFEDELQSNVTQMLDSVFGQGNSKVQINSDLDFDSNQITTIQYDKNDVVTRSSQLTTEKDVDTTGQGGVPGTSSQTTSTYTSTTSNGGSSTIDKSDNTTNNEIGQTTTTTVKAPGEVKRMTVSVLINGTLNQNEKAEIQNIVAAAVGYNPARGDVINISALPFNTDQKDQVAKDAADMLKQEQAQKTEQLVTKIAIGAGALILLIILLVAISRRRKNEESETNSSIDFVVNNNVIPKQPAIYEPILDGAEEDMNLEKEIQGYATKKPDQVAEVIRTWLSDDDAR